MSKSKSSVVVSLVTLLLGVVGLGVLIWLSTPGKNAVKPVSASKTAQEAPPPPHTFNPLITDTSLSVPLEDPFKVEIQNQKFKSSQTAINPLPTIPTGVDPFKEKLLQQAKQAKEEASISPFGTVPKKP